MLPEAISSNTNGTVDATSTTTNDFRVRNVAEINDHSEAEAGTSTSMNATKRKLPEWMTGAKESKQAEAASTSNEEATPAKKCRVVENAVAVETSEDNGDNIFTAPENGSAEAQEPKAEDNVDANESTTNEEQQDSPEETDKTNEATTANDAQVQVKTEPTDDDAPCTSSGVVNPTNIKATVKVEKADASSTSRESCRFGMRCYRRNPMHRIEEAHPGDHDYKRPNYPAPPAGTPMCPWADKCYRRNPAHFQQFDHPPEN